jgi:hypothetical protein
MSIPINISNSMKEFIRMIRGRVRDSSSLYPLPLINNINYV